MKPPRLEWRLSQHPRQLCFSGQCIRLHQQIFAFYEDIYNSPKKPYREGIRKVGDGRRVKDIILKVESVLLRLSSATFLPLP